MDLDRFSHLGTLFRLIRSVSQIAAACSVLFLPVGCRVRYVWAHGTEFVSKKSVVLISIHWTSRGGKICLEAKTKCKRDSIWIIPPLELRFPVLALFQKEDPIPPRVLLLTISPGK